MTKALDGKVALITGAGRNIGRVTALTLAAEGADLVLCTKESKDDLMSTAAEAREKYGVKVLARLADITKVDEVRSLVQAAEAELGRVDILVNNATWRFHATFLKLTPEQWDKTVAINLNAPFYLCQAVLPGMVARRWGRIINYSGNSAFLGRSPAAASTKAGVLGLTRSLASEFGKHNITVNCISPGGIKVTRSPGAERKSDITGKIDERVPIQRFGTPDEVAGLVAYLASEAAGYVTGQCIAMNGGAYYI